MIKKKVIAAALILSTQATQAMVDDAVRVNGLVQSLRVPNLSAGVGFNEQYHNRQIALWSLQQINANMPLIDDPWSVQVLYTMTAQMNALVRAQPIIAVPLINDNNINAFAVPGGVIGMNTGTVLAAGGLDEVASVLAHEVAHLSQRHYEHRSDNAKKLMAIQLGGLMAALAASAAGGDAALAVMAGSQTASAENAAAHSREHEREADRVGQQILSEAGYDARAMPRFFNQLYRQVSLNQSKNAFLPSFMQSHPFTMERLSEASARAANYPHVAMSEKQVQDKLFDELYWRLKYLSKQATRADLTANANQSDGARLALVMHLTDHHEYQAAQRVFDQGGFGEYDVLPSIVQAHLHTAQHHYDKAVSALSRIHNIYPERRDLRLYLAHNLIHDGQIAEALALIQSLVHQNPHDVQAWQLIRQAYEQKARADTDARTRDISTIYALQARSQVELWTGKYQGALQSNAQAIKVAKNHQDLSALIGMLDKDKEIILTARDFKPK